MRGAPPNAEMSYEPIGVLYLAEVKITKHLGAVSYEQHDPENIITDLCCVVSYPFGRR